MVAANSLLLFLLTTGLTPDLEQPTTPTPWRSISETEEPPVNEDSQFEAEGPLPCPKHERFDKCLAHCQRNCTNYKEKYIPCTMNCVPGCICVEGYVRGPDEKCIPKEKCSSMLEFFSYELQSDMLNCCSDFGTCKPGCICDSGYVRGLNGKCMQRNKCPRKPGWESISETEEPPVNEYEPHERCKNNRIYSHCGAYPECQKTCKNYDKVFPCPLVCQSGCICKEGYVEGPNTECIRKEECRHDSEDWDSETEQPPVTEVNEFESDDDRCPKPNTKFSKCEAYPPCQKNCENHDQIIPCPRICVSGCICEDGFVEGHDGECIAVDKCPPRSEDDRCPKPNTKFSKCEAYPPCQKNCENHDQIIPCPRICVSGCICEDGFVEGHDGECIEVDKCPPRAEDHKCTKENTKYTECGAYPFCQKTCENHDRIIPCPPICLPGCVCKDGFVKNSEGECIAIDKCPPKSEGPEQCREHEHWDKCLAHCQKNCTNYNKIVPCAKICRAGCICDEGHVRGPNGKCIPVGKCPRLTERKNRKRSCPPREHISLCMGHCQKTCDNYKKPTPCPRKCEKGCVCDGGLVRGPIGKCIMPSKCPAKLAQEENIYN
ncbi:uncharacterized protein TNIN_220711 [Trichonephila inaurata madagascariensis]|uniref:TIL domain-containing protein n=1 Tax=Trichonephila inaurata madagascariensis TaxID=2747483 RepID=A0A8X6XHY4_9ARAC|nr:uncharacterized protein TNIN_220711 [Trichonephila inaurata madagascariensis]